MTEINKENEQDLFEDSSEQKTDNTLLQEIDAELKEERLNKRKASTKLTGLVLLVGAIVAWIAALQLLVDKLFLLQNPGATLGCDINPFISCGSVMMTWQASAFGIPNMAIGLAGFAIMGVVGSLMISNVKLPQWFNWAALGGMTFAFGFIHFLSYSAIFIINALCPWCMVIWIAVDFMFFAKLAETVEQKKLHIKYKWLNILRHWIVLSFLWCILVVSVIFIQFFDQWMIMLGI